MKKLAFITLMFNVLVGWAAPSLAAVLVYSSSGAYTTKPSLAVAATSADCAGKKIVFTTDQTLTANLNWPADRELIPENRAKINHGAYTISSPAGQTINTSRWPLAQIFKGTGLVTGLSESRPEWFGADGDGGDDYAAIASAMAASNHLILQKGRIYASASRIRVPSAITITGGGTLKALPLGPNATIQGFLYGNRLSDVTIDGIAIDSSPATQTHALLSSVLITHSNRIRITNNSVTCSYSGVYVRDGSSDVTVSGNQINNSYGTRSDAALQHGPSIIVGANNAVVHGNHVTGIISTAVSDSLIATGIYAGTDTGFTYTNIAITGNTVKYSYTAYSAANVNKLTISGNVASDCRTKNHSQGVLLTHCNGASVVGNTLSNIDFTAIALVDCKGSTVASNTITNDADFLIGSNKDANRANGITVSQTVAGGSGYNKVIGNTINVGGSHASASYIGILVYGDGSTVSGNSVEASTVAVSTGLQFSGENFAIENNKFIASYIGIRVIEVGGWTQTKNNTIENNVIYSSGVHPIYDVSARRNRYLNNTVRKGLR
jgi:parallel beta-helix repeat protein